MSQPSSSLRYATSTSTLRPTTPMSIATLQERTQWQWGNLHWALGCPVFVTLLYILVFGLDPSQARLLEARSDLSHFLDPQQPLQEDYYAILFHLYWLATPTANEPVLELSSVVSRFEMWKAFHQLVLTNARPLTTERFGSVKAGEIQKFLSAVGHSMDLSRIRYWTGRLWHTLPFEPSWHLPFAINMTLEQEGQVTNNLGTLQEVLEVAALEPAFDPKFLVPIAASRFSWCAFSLQEWSQTAQATELALQAVHRIFKCRTDRQGMVFLVVVVLVHYFQSVIPPSVLHTSGPPSLVFDFGEVSFCRSLEALTTYVDLFDLHDVLSRPVFTLVQGLRAGMSPERVNEWHYFWMHYLPTTLVNREDLLVEV
ncbi:hypothetical protein ABVK25_012392 [Lepraria finkii]|uniref:Uncharacterized protein n=1 Tax=Lepraria finkii TaxID=1340010 RepID=A0ABR4AIL2_9LECA